MALESSLLMLLSDKVIQLVFKEILQNRSVLFKEIFESLAKKPELETAMTKFSLEDAVKSLKDADLIKERSAPIEDFNTYYVTANGLSAERQLRLAGSDTGSSLL
jgi:hypothetical protein